MNSIQENTSELPQIALKTLLVLVSVKLCLHIVLGNRYGFHGDELYFIACGRMPAFGYVDHPPLIPWLARAMELLVGESLRSYRFPTALAGALALALTMLITRELRGGWFAQTLAGLAFLSAPVFLLGGNMLNIPGIEIVFWTMLSYLSLLAINRAQPRYWLLVGIVAGLGLLAKHSLSLWGAGLVTGLLLTRERRHLLSPWIWAGGGLALLIFLPNVLWQWNHDWATVEFLRQLNASTRLEVGPMEFLISQLLYLNPACAPIWIGGVVFYLSRHGRHWACFAALFLVPLLILLVLGGKAYYLAAAYPVVLAGGGVLWERVVQIPSVRAATLSVVALFGILLGLVGLPLFPLDQKDRVVGRLLGGEANAAELTMELHRQYAWRECADSALAAFEALPEPDRPRAGILTAGYNHASAINFFNEGKNLPRAASGHMSYYYWGPPADNPEIIVAVGFKENYLKNMFEEVKEVARTGHPLGTPYDRDIPIHVCRGLRGTWTEVWPSLRRFGHRGERVQ